MADSDALRRSERLKVKHGKQGNGPVFNATKAVLKAAQQGKQPADGSGSDSQQDPLKRLPNDIKHRETVKKWIEGSYFVGHPLVGRAAYRPLDNEWAFRLAEAARASTERDKLLIIGAPGVHAQDRSFPNNIQRRAASVDDQQLVLLRQNPFSRDVWNALANGDSDIETA